MGKELPLEKDFQRAVLKKLRLIPESWWTKVNDRVTIGLPDILGCVRGNFVALELKTKSKVTKLQAHTLSRIERARGWAYVVTPHNFEQVLEYLKQL